MRAGELEGFALRALGGNASRLFPLVSSISPLLDLTVKRRRDTTNGSYLQLICVPGDAQISVSCHSPISLSFDLTLLCHHDGVG